MTAIGVSLSCLVLCLSSLLTFTNARFYDFESLYSKDPSIVSVNEHFDQTVDHFNAYNAAQTFSQRWYYSTQYWSGAANQGPLLFMAGGEGTNNGGYYSFVTEFAQEVGGLLLTAEHRFYGQSMPFGTHNSFTHDSNHLGLLQVEQAMADYMTLVDYWQNQFFNCTACPVLVFGVSYPGELATWLRVKYPAYFDIALASSGPIFYTSNFLVDPLAYYQVITSAANKHSAQCVTQTKLYNSALTSSTPTQITAAIPLCSPLSSNKEQGLNELLAYLYELWANYGMGNYPPSSSGMLSACNRMSAASRTNGLAVLSAFLQPYRNSNGCVDLATKVPSGTAATIHCSDLTGCGTGLGGESWDYQACSQNIEPFATDGVNDMFPVWPWNMTWLDQHCMSRFGIKASTRDAWMEMEFGLNPKYFDTKFGALTSRIIFSNGMQDGWHAGGVLVNMSDTIIAIPIENGAHGSDMHGTSSHDTPDMTAARNQERTILKQWIKEVTQEKRDAATAMADK